MVQEPHSEIIKVEDESEQCSVLSSESEDSVCDEMSGSSNFLDLKPLRVSDCCSLLTA